MTFFMNNRRELRQMGGRFFVKWVNRTWTNNQIDTCQITKRKLTKQPSENLPNNQIVIKFFVCFREKLYFCTKILLYGRAF